MSRNSWLGAAEKLVFEAFKGGAPFVSPFSINNPDGWRYWLIHFANSYRARQVYNNVLHDNASSQAHFGRSGLNMLAYDPEHENGSLYLFDVSGREAAKRQLLDDIPRLVTDLGDAVGVEAFYEEIYNATPAHADDVHTAIIENPDLEVITSMGGVRRKANTITVGDTIRMKMQKSFFPSVSWKKKRRITVTNDCTITYPPAVPLLLTRTSPSSVRCTGQLSAISSTRARCSSVSAPSSVIATRNSSIWPSLVSQSAQSFA
jgi:hypothetical protein